MNIKTFLGLLGDRQLSSVQPEGGQVLSILETHCDPNDLVHNVSGMIAHELIDKLPLDIRNQVYNTELNDGVDLIKYHKELQSLMDDRDLSAKRTRTILAFGFSTLLAAMALSVSYAILHVAINKNELPPWELCLIAFSGPVLVVWQYNGVMTQERKDLLAAAIGKTPQAGIIGGLLNSLTPKDTPKRSRQEHGGPPSN